MHFRPAVLLLVAAATATAQVPTLEPNSSVRIDLMDRTWLLATFTSQSADSAFVWSKSAGRNHGIGWSSIDRIRVSMGKNHRLGAQKGALYGGIGGAVLATALMAFMGEGVPLSVAASVGATGGMMYGYIIGVIIGSEVWKTVYTRP